MPRVSVPQPPTSCVSMIDHEPLPVLMAQVLGALPPIGKDDKAPANMGGYSFRGIESITSALKPLLAKHGVFCVPKTIDRIGSQRSVGQSKTMFVVDVLVEFTFYGPSGDSITCSTWGEGTDMGDKATQKAYTSSFKSMLAQVFCIADSATDSERHEVPDAEKVAYATEADTRALVEKIKARPAEVRDRIKWLMAKDGLSFTTNLTPDELSKIAAWEEEIPGTDPPVSVSESDSSAANGDTTPPSDAVCRGDTSRAGDPGPEAPVSPAPELVERAAALGEKAKAKKPSESERLEAAKLA